MYLPFLSGFLVSHSSASINLSFGSSSSTDLSACMQNLLNKNIPFIIFLAFKSICRLFFFLSVVEATSTH